MFTLIQPYWNDSLVQDRLSRTDILCCLDCWSQYYSPTAFHNSGLCCPSLSYTTKENTWLLNIAKIIVTFTKEQETKATSLTVKPKTW